jgi:hypothetical protein
MGSPFLIFEIWGLALFLHHTLLMPMAKSTCSGHPARKQQVRQTDRQATTTGQADKQAPAEQTDKQTSISTKIFGKRPFLSLYPTVTSQIDIPDYYFKLL